MVGSEVIGDLLIKLLILLVVAKVFGWIATYFKQPSVLGELLAGVVLGPSILGIIHPLIGEVGGLSTHILTFLAEIGVIILLFQVGLESKLSKLLKVGFASVLVAFAGVIFPFALTFSFFASMGYSTLIGVFVGATFSATSIGITMRVLEDMKKIDTTEARIILGAADIDDVIALIALSILIGIVEAGSVSYFNIGKIAVFAVLFLVASLFIGFAISGALHKMLEKLKVVRTFIYTSFIFALGFAYLANAIGLATIVGAFVAGLVLERSKDRPKLEEKLKPLANIFVPIFFVMAGVKLNLHVLFNLQNLPIIFVLIGIAILGKMLSGFFAYCPHGKKVNKLAVSLGMIPRGEVGLIFATYGLAYGVLDQYLYAIVVVVIMLTTFVTPTPLEWVMEKVKED